MSNQNRTAAIDAWSMRLAGAIESLTHFRAGIIEAAALHPAAVDGVALDDLATECYSVVAKLLADLEGSEYYEFVELVIGGDYMGIVADRGRGPGQ